MSGIMVLVPTVGRLPQLRRCLESIGACDPRPAEVIVLDQSGSPAVDDLAAKVDAALIRVVHSSVRGIAVNLNRGLDLARTDIVATTHDDCTMAPAWIGVLEEHLRSRGRGIVT